MAEKLTEQPISIDNNNISISQLSSFENRRVNIRGTFLHQHEMLVGPRNKGGPGRPGYYLYTPLLVDQSK
jgi:surfeit locus 1 family protein